MEILKHIISFAVFISGFWFLVWHASRKRLDPSCVNVLSVALLTKVLVVCSALAFVYIIFDISSSMFELLIGGLVAVFVLIVAIDIVTTRVVCSDQFLMKINAFTTVRIRWDDIENVYPSRIDHAFCVEDRSGVVIKINYLIVGAAALELEIEQKMR